MHRFASVLSVLLCLAQAWQTPCEHCIEDALACPAGDEDAQFLAGFEHRPGDSEEHHDHCCTDGFSLFSGGKRSLERPDQPLSGVIPTFEPGRPIVQHSAAAIESPPPPNSLRSHLAKRVLLV